MKIYGIKNCDTMQKAFKWLDSKGIAYTFHDYKLLGINKVTINKWLKKKPLNEIVNFKSTTYKNLTDDEKSLLIEPASAIQVMIDNPSIIKRPVLESGTRIITGFREEQWLAFIA